MSRKITVVVPQNSTLPAIYSKYREIKDAYLLKTEEIQQTLQIASQNPSTSTDPGAFCFVKYLNLISTSFDEITISQYSILVMLAKPSQQIVIPVKEFLKQNQTTTYRANPEHGYDFYYIPKKSILVLRVLQKQGQSQQQYEAQTFDQNGLINGCTENLDKEIKRTADGSDEERKTCLKKVHSEMVTHSVPKNQTKLISMAPSSQTTQPDLQKLEKRSSSRQSQLSRKRIKIEVQDLPSEDLSENQTWESLMQTIHEDVESALPQGPLQMKHIQTWIENPALMQACKERRIKAAAISIALAKLVFSAKVYVKRVRSSLPQNSMINLFARWSSDVLYMSQRVVEEQNELPDEDQGNQEAARVIYPLVEQLTKILHSEDRMAVQLRDLRFDEMLKSNLVTEHELSDSLGLALDIPYQIPYGRRYMDMEEKYPIWDLIIRSVKIGMEDIFKSANSKELTPSFRVFCKLMPKPVQNKFWDRFTSKKHSQNIDSLALLKVYELALDSGQIQEFNRLRNNIQTSPDKKAEFVKCYISKLGVADEHVSIKYVSQFQKLVWGRLSFQNHRRTAARDHMHMMMMPVTPEQALLDELRSLAYSFQNMNSNTRKDFPILVKFMFSQLEVVTEQGYLQSILKDCKGTQRILKPDSGFHKAFISLLDPSLLDHNEQTDESVAVISRSFANNMKLPRWITFLEEYLFSVRNPQATEHQQQALLLQETLLMKQLKSAAESNNTRPMQVVGLLKHLSDPQVAAFLKILKGLVSLMERNDPETQLRSFEMLNIQKWATMLQDFVRETCCEENPAIGVIQGLRVAMMRDKQKTDEHVIISRKHKARGNGEEDLVYKTLVGFLPELSNKTPSAQEFRAKLTEQILKYESLEAKIGSLKRLLDTESMNQVPAMYSLVSDFLGLVADGAIELKSVADIETWIHQNHFQQLFNQENRTLVEYYIRNRANTYFKRKFDELSAQIIRLPDFLRIVEEARKNLLDELRDMEDNSSSFESSKFQFYFKGVVRLDKQTEIERMLRSVELEEKVLRNLITKAKQFTAFLNLYEMVYEGFLHKILNWERFKREGKPGIKDQGLVNQILKFKEHLGTNVVKNTQTGLPELDYRFLKEIENSIKKEFKTKLTDNVLIQNMLIDAFNAISKAEQLVAFLSESTKDFLQKVKDECDITYLTMINELQDATTKLAFMCDEQVQAGVYSEQSIFEKIFKFTQEDFILISGLNYNLFTLKGLKAKIQGDRKKLAQDVLNISCAVFRRIEHKETFEFTMFTPIINKVNNDGTLRTLEEQKAQKQVLIDDLRSKTYDEMHRGAYYTFEDMRGHFTYAGILSTELERSQNSSDNAQAETQTEVLQLMKDLSLTGQQIMKFRDNLIQLHELGLIRKEFGDEILNFLGCRRADTKFLYNSTVKTDSLKDCLFLKIDKEQTLNLLCEANRELSEQISESKKNYRAMINDLQTSGMSYFSGEKAHNLFLYLRQHKSGTQFEFEPTKWLLSEFLNIQERFDIPPEVQATLQREDKLDVRNSFEICKSFFRSKVMNPSIELKQETVDDKNFSSTCANFVDLRNLPQNLNSLDFMLRIIGQSARHMRPAINLSQILFCNEQTTELELSSFVSRCRLDKFKRVFFILNVKDLPESRLSDLIYCISKIYSGNQRTEQTSQDPPPLDRELKKKASSTQTQRKEKEKFSHSVSGGKLLIFNNGQSGVFPSMDGFDDVTNKFESWCEYSLQVDPYTREDCVNYRLKYIENLRKVQVVSSKQAGLGKTYRIRHEARELEKQGYITSNIELSISGEVTRQSLTTKVEKLYNQISGLSSNKKFALHIKLDYIEDFEKHSGMIDFLLYSILFAGKANNSSGIITLSDKIEKVFIEIGNSIKGKLEKLEMIRLLKRWDDDNKKIQEAERKFTSNLFTEVCSLRDANSVIGYSEPADPIFYACAAIIKQLQKLGSQPKSWDPVDIPDLKPPGMFYQPDPKQSVVSYNVTFDEMNKILRQEFLRINCEAFENFFCLEYWVKIILALVKDVQACSKLNAAIEVPQAPTAKSIVIKVKGTIDPEELRMQVLSEVINTAIQALKIHNPESLKIQKDVIEIYEAEDDQKMEALLEEKKQAGLKEMIEKENWNPRELFIPFCTSDDFVPVLGSQEMFSSSSTHSPEMGQGNSGSTNNRAILRRYVVKLQGDYEEKIFAQRVSAHTNHEHSWFAYCLSKMSLNANNQRGYEQIMEITKNFSGKKGYALTLENFMKINIILLKAKMKQPIIIMGESGCGKTYLSQFVVEGLLEDKLRMITLYSGYSESNLISQVNEFVEEARQLKKENKSLWVFFDEFNTTAIQSIIADLLIDRVYPTANNLHEKVPDNMLFIACCNPFRIKLEKKDGANIGLVPHEKTTRLSHIVKPIPDRLLNLVMDFGQLTKADEKYYIDSLVRAENIFELVDFTKTFDPNKEYPSSELLHHRLKNIKYSNLSLLIHRIHSYVRQKEERSGVSLRDIKRVCLMFKWFRHTIHEIKQFLDKHPHPKFKKSTYWIIRSPNLIELAASLCAVSVCYVLRMNGFAEYQKEMYNLMHGWATYAAGMESINYDNVKDALRQVSQAFLYNIKKIIPNDISQNQAFEENFITLLACYSIKIPLIIVGAPGTSKTLSTNIFLQSLDGNKDQYTLFHKFEEAESIYFGGSQTSTSEAVERLFDRADNFYKVENRRRQENKAQMVISPKEIITQKAPVIFFDELGLAELSPHNPLKVMHSRLETNQGKIAFIGVSNWKPDQSKVNRMVCLMRPDMTRQDLIEIFETSLNSLMQPGEFPRVRKVFECLSETYLIFREWQKKIGKQNRTYHPYFHGSRDIYGCYNYLFHQIKTQAADFSKLKQESPEFKAKILEIIKKAIERNLNGEAYYFTTKPMKKQNNVKDASGRLLCSSVLYDEKNQLEPIFGGYLQKDMLDVQAHDTPCGDLDNFSDLYKEYGHVVNNWFNMTSSEVFKYFYLGLLNKKYDFKIGELNISQKTWIKDPLMKELVAQNISDSNSRFMIVRSEGQIIDELLMQTLKQKKREILTNKGKENDPDKIVDWRQVNDKDGIDDLLSSFKTYVSHGYTVVMKNLDSLYGGLYDLFNQKYTTVASEGGGSSQTSKKCFLYYGETRHSVTVHPEFKCIILIDSSVESLTKDDIQKKHPAPFLNRFEKYFLKLIYLLEPEKFNLLRDLRDWAWECAKGKFSRIPGMNLDHLISLIEQPNPFDDEQDKKISHFRSTLALMTSNFMYNDPQDIFDGNHDIEKAYLRVVKNSFADILKRASNPTAIRYKQIILTFSPKSKLEFLKTDPIFSEDLNKFLILDPTTVTKNFLIEKDRILQDVHQPVIFQFGSSQDYALIPAVRRIIDERMNIGSVVLIVHMSKADREIFGRRAVKKDKSGFFQTGERSKLLNCGGINTWDGWNCQTNENLEFEIPAQLVGKILNMSIVDCFLPETPVSKSSAELEWVDMFAHATMKKVICAVLESFSLDPKEDYGEINVPELRKIFGTSFADHRVIKQLFELLRGVIRSKLTKPTEEKLSSKVDPNSDESNFEDIYEDLPSVIQRTVLEDNYLKTVVANVLADINSYCCNLYSTLLGVSQDLNSNSEAQFTLSEFVKVSRYGEVLFEALKDHSIRRPNLHQLASNSSDFRRSVSIPKNLRAPENELYIKFLTKHFEREENEQIAMLTNIRSVWMVTNQFIKAWSSESKSEAIVIEKHRSAVAFQEIENSILLKLEKIAKQLPTAIPRRTQPTTKEVFVSKDRTSDYAIDLIRILFGNKLRFLKNPKLQQSELDDFYRICNLLVVESMERELEVKYELQDNQVSSQARKFIVALYPMYMCCEYFQDQMDSIMKSINLLSNPISEFKSLFPRSSQFNSQGKREVPFFQLQLLENMFERLKFESFKQERSYGRISISDIVVKLKAKTGIDSNYKKLMVGSYELLNMLDKSDKKTAFSEDLILIDFQKESQESQSIKESNRRFDTAILKCARNIYNLALVDNLDLLLNMKKTDPNGAFSKFVDIIGQLLRHYVAIAKDFTLLIEPQYQRLLFNGTLFSSEDLTTISNQICPAVIDLVKDFVPRESLRKIALQDSESSPYAELNDFCNCLWDCYEFPLKLVMSTCLANSLYVQAVRFNDQRGAAFGNEFRSQIEYFETLCEIYQTGIAEIPKPDSNLSKKPKGLAIMLSSTLMRVFLSKELLRRLLYEDPQQVDKLHNLLDPTNAESSALLDKINNNPDFLPMVFYLQKLYSLNSKFTPEQTTKLEPVKKLIDSYKDTKDLTRVILFDDNMTQHYLSQMCSKLDLFSTKYTLDSPGMVNDLDELLSQQYQVKAGTNHPTAQLYIAGLYILNTFIVSQDMDELSLKTYFEKKKIMSLIFETLRTKYKSKLQGPGVTDTDNLKIRIMFCNFVINILRQWTVGKMKYFYGEEYDVEADIRVSKLYLQGILMVLCFPQEMRYNPLKIDEWLCNSTIDQSKFYCLIVTSGNFTNYCNQLEVIINSRLSDTSYRDFGGALVKNLGVYMCPCGFMYSIMNCGYAVSDSACPNKCGRRIGGNSHKSFEYIKHLKTLEDVFEEVIKEYNSKKSQYGPHETSSESAMSMKIVELGYNIILESQKADQKQIKLELQDYINNFYFRHLMDHIYLLGLPYILDVEQQQKFETLATGNLRLDVDNFWQTFKGGAVKKPEAYFLRHIEYDLDKIKGLIQLENHKDILDWFKAVLSKGADMILKGGQPDSKTKLYLDRSMFLKPQEILNEQNSATDKMAGQSFKSDAQTARKIVEQRVGSDLSTLGIKDETAFRFYRGIFGAREFSLADAATQFDADFQEGGMLQISYPLIHSCTKFQKLYSKYESVLGSALELYQYVDAMYSGKYTYEQTLDKSIDLLSHKDPCLRNLHDAFSDIWLNQVLEGLIKEFPNEFEFSFTCHAGMEVPEYIQKVTHSTTPIINFIFMESSSQYADQKLFYPKSIIQSLVKKIQNPLVNLARKKLGLIKPEQGAEEMGEGKAEPRMQSLEITGTDVNYNEFLAKPIRNTSREDLLKFNMPDLRTDVLQYARLVSTDGNHRLEFDYKAYELYLAEAIVSRNCTIGVEDNDFKNFMFGEQNSGSVSTSAEIYIKVLNSFATELPEETTELIEREFTPKSQNSLEKLYHNLVEVCREFRQANFYEHKSSVVAKLQELAKTDSELVDVIHQSGCDWEVFETIKIKHLGRLYQYLKERVQADSDFLTQAGNVPIDAALQEKLTLGFDVISRVAKSDPECKEMLKELIDTIQSTVMDSFFPDSAKMSCPLYGLVGDDDDFEKYLDKELQGSNPTLISEFCTTWNKCTFLNSLPLIKMLERASK